MTRSQRRIALRKRTAASAGLPDTFTPAGSLADNPNRGKHHTARMMPTDLDIERMTLAARVPVPLTVATPLLTASGRHSRRLGRNVREIHGKAYSQYTI